MTDKKVTAAGNHLKIEWTCLKNHHGRWASWPDARGMAQNNQLVSAATLFSGTTFTEVHEWAIILNCNSCRKS